MDSPKEQKDLCPMERIFPTFPWCANSSPDGVGGIRSELGWVGWRRAMMSWDGGGMGWEGKEGV